MLKPKPEEALVAHRTARLNEFGRQLLVDRVLGEGWTVATAAEARGQPGDRLQVGPSVPARRTGRPGSTAAPGPAARPRPRRPQEVRADRRGPGELALGSRPPGAAARPARPRPSAPCCAGTGCRRLADIDRPTGVPVRRYEACHPGALVHQDHKKLGRIPDGGGHRALGRATDAAARHRAGLGYDHFEVDRRRPEPRAVVVAGARRERRPAPPARWPRPLAVFAAEGSRSSGC